MFDKLKYFGNKCFLYTTWTSSCLFPKSSFTYSLHFTQLIHGLTPDRKATSLKSFPASSLYRGLSSLALAASHRFSFKLSPSRLDSWCVLASSFTFWARLFSDFSSQLIISSSLGPWATMALTAWHSSLMFSCVSFSLSGARSPEVTCKLKS